MIKIRLLGSGSGGNCTLISSGDCHILIDCGLPARRIRHGLQEAGIRPDRLSGILVSHEHNDHVSGLPVFLKAAPVPLFMSPGTAANVTINGTEAPQEHFQVGQPFGIGPMEVLPFAVSHDAVDPSGFVIRCRGVQLAHVTDLGCVTELVRQRVRQSHCLVIESNHDEDMVKIGPYPWALKQRVLSRVGHLSNRDLARFLAQDFDGLARTVVLAHISRKNNHPEIARHVAGEALAGRSFTRADAPEIIVAEQDHASPWIVIE
jgi:phosphoribosyl 1,2-cyclic phosphodiesterase